MKIELFWLVLLSLSFFFSFFTVRSLAKF